jgi:shikimate kinase / 3-dehydroquinate synthase
MSEGISLSGLSGSGKSSVARLLAERLGRPCRDTDAMIAQRVGEPAPSYLRRCGETAFREAERQALLDACGVPGAVIATGGGALNDPLGRWALMRHGLRVWLDAPIAQLVARLAADEEERPLLDGDAPAALARLAQERWPFYRASDLHVDAARAPESVADEIAARTDGARGGRLFDADLARHHPQGPASARVMMGIELSAVDLNDALGPLADRRRWVIADRRAARALPPLLDALQASARLEIIAGERAKRLRGVERVTRWLAEQRAERGDAVIAFGGGTTGDLVGMAAAIYARGAPLVQVPTTWLAQVDSALGGKVGVDLVAAKNALGAFWPAWAVVSDVAALRRQPARQLRNGLAEAIKSAIIGDPQLWQLIEERGVAALGDDEAARYAIGERAARVKLGVVERDPYEAGERRQLNLGHTVGHALEAESRYRLAHGEAVALGMRAAAAIAAGRGASGVQERLDSLLGSLGYRLRHAFDAGAVRSIIGLDKKRERGRQRWLLPMGIGQVADVDDVTDAEVDLALRAITETDR